MQRDGLNPLVKENAERSTPNAQSRIKRVAAERASEVRDWALDVRRSAFYSPREHSPPPTQADRRSYPDHAGDRRAPGKISERALSLSSSRPQSKELLPAIAGIDKVSRCAGKPTTRFDWIALSLGKFDYCLDFTRNDRSSFLTFLSGARKRITSDHPKLRTKMRARSYNEFVEAPVGTLHTVDYHLALLKPLGIDDASRAIRLRFAGRDRLERRSDSSTAAEAGDEFVVFIPARPARKNSGKRTAGPR